MKTNHQAAAAETTWVIVAAALAAIAMLVVLLKPATVHAAPSNTPTVSTATTKLGRVLVDSRGHTLYLFEKDTKGRSACTGQCATFWPPLIVKSKPTVGGGAKSSLIGTFRRADGRLQVTYNHHPLYTFTKDTKKGQTTGEGLSAFGAEWDAVSPVGAAVEKTTSGGGGSGY